MRRTLTATMLAALVVTVGCAASTTTNPTASGGSVGPTPAADATNRSRPTDTATAASSLTGGLDRFFDAGSSADDAVVRLRSVGRNADADRLEKIAAQPTAVWLGEWTPDVTGTVRSITERAAGAGAIALFVVYNVPGRDCGLYSAGGAPADSYLAWVSQVAAGIAPGSVAWFVLEPDALAQLGDCDGQADRPGLLAQAARILADAEGRVFLDVGNSNWKSPETMADRLAMVGTENLAGFATNTSNYNSTARESVWGKELATRTGLPFVIDTSRNGNGAPDDAAWCNPRGRATGQPPRIVDPEGPLVAMIWAKVPGESDGTCNGGPAAGVWWDEIALELAR